MPPRKRAPAPPAHRVKLEEDLTALGLTDHRALADLARLLADELDRPARPCKECGGHDGPDPRIVARYLEVLTALGVGEIPAAPPTDEFSDMLLTFARTRTREVTGR